MSPCGLIVLNKPVGISSRRALNQVARLVKPAKAGHAGTLDPIADGVLVTCIGSATRLIRYVQQMPKTYRATFLLGCDSPSDDIEQEPVPRIDPPIPTAAEIEAAMAQFSGIIQQRPPTFSAIKINGQRAYDMARAGKPLEMQLRPVRIDAFQLLCYDYPQLTAEITCGSGTYVRSLGRDLAEQVGTGAVMSELTRTAIGTYDLAASVAPEKLTADNLGDWLLAPSTAVPHLPKVVVDAQQLIELHHGRTIERPSDSTATEVAALTPEGELVAILSPVAEDLWRATCNFTHTLSRQADRPS